MKKITMTLVILLGLTMGAFAENGGLFGMGETRSDSYSTRSEGLLEIGLPSEHGLDGDQGASPLGSGTVLMLGLGAAYLASKKHREE